MKQIHIIALILVVGALSTVAHADSTSDGNTPCIGWNHMSDTPDKTIADCTALIQAGGNGELALAYKVRARAYEDKLDDADAIADYKQTMALSPTTESDLLFKRGDFLNAPGSSQRAIAYYSAAITLKPDYGNAFVGRGDAYEEMGDYANAIADYSSAIALAPQAYSFYTARCGARAESGKDIDLALADCNQSLALRDNYFAHDARGLVYLRMGRFKDAITEYKASLAGGKIEGDPPSADTYYGMGVAKLHSGDKTGSADIAHAKNIGPKMVARLATMGVKP